METVPYYDNLTSSKRINVINDNFSSVRPIYTDKKALYISPNNHIFFHTNEHINVNIYDTCYAPALYFIKNHTKEKSQSFLRERQLLLTKKINKINKGEFLSPLDIKDLTNDTPGISKFFCMLNLVNDPFSKDMYDIAIGAWNTKYSIYRYLDVLLEETNKPVEALESVISNQEVKDILSDILVRIMGFDKIETNRRKTITTTKININETFFNYLINDYTVTTLPRLYLDKETNCFKPKIRSDFISTSKEKELETEISLIKKKVNCKHLNNYLK